MTKTTYTESKPVAPLRLLIIANSINPEGRVGIGGAERTALDIATQVDRSVIEPSILTYENPGEMKTFLDSKNVAVHYLKKCCKLDPLLFQQLRTLCERHRYDAILSVNTGANLDNLVVSRKLESTACLIRVPSVRVKFRVAMTEGRIANRADVLIVPSVDAKHGIVGRYVIDSSKIRVIPNGCSSGQYYAVQYYDRYLYRSELDLPEDATVFYTSSRVHPVKGQDVFAEALSKIPSTELEAKKVLWVNTGRVQDSRFLNRIKRITRKISNHVLFLPPVTEPAKWYGVSDWVVIPSRAESFGISMLEAAYVGRPIFASRCGIAKELDGIRDRLTFDPGDVQSALDGLKYILSLGIEQRLSIADKVHKYYINKYSLESTVRKYERVIVEAVEFKRSRNA